MKIQDRFIIDIVDMGTEGEGIGRAEGAAVFVPKAVVGDKALVEITQVKKNFARGEIVEVTEPSDVRVEPVCPYASSCGGCPLASISYKGQLELKKKWVTDRLKRIGGIENVQVADVIGMEAGFPVRYRNKAQFPVQAGRLVKNHEGKYRNQRPCSVGFYRPRTHEVIHCDSCLIQTEPAEAIAAAVKRYVDENTVSVFDEKSHMGLLRHVVVRTAFVTGEVMVVLVVNGNHLPKQELLIEMMDDAVNRLADGRGDRAGNGSEADRKAQSGQVVGAAGEELGAAGEEVAAVGEEVGGAEAVGRGSIECGMLETASDKEQFWSLESVILNVNKAKGSEILGKECITLAGSSTITDYLGDLQFEISPQSFYQVNPVQMVKLYDKVVEFAQLTGEETILDIYCGVGTIGLYCAGKAKRVIGIESVRSAVLNANRNAVINGIVNAEYIYGKAEEVLPKRLAGIKADVVILDPPRSGCDKVLLEAVQNVAPNRIVYVSCDPATLARDVKLLCAEDGSCSYQVERVQPVDMFPGAGHVETCVLLSHKNS